MNDLKKRALIRSVIGFAGGLAIGMGFILTSSAGNPLTIALYLLASGLYGAVNMGTSAVYGIERWSIVRTTATHFGIVALSSCAFFGLLIGAGWMPLPPLGMCLILLAAYLAAYFLVWLICYLRGRRDIRRLNEDLEKIKSAQ